MSLDKSVKASFERYSVVRYSFQRLKYETRDNLERTMDELGTYLSKDSESNGAEAEKIANF